MEQALRVPEAVWVATALLHREHPDRMGFQVDEIQARLLEMGYPESATPRIEVHATLQLVANMRPNPAPYRYLYATPDGGRRLYRPGDDHHTGRDEGPVHPRREDLPREHHELITWYEEDYASRKDAATPDTATPLEGRQEAATASPPPQDQRVTYKVLRVDDASEAESLLKRFAEEGWRLRETVAPHHPDRSGSVWLVLERPR